MVRAALAGLTCHRPMRSRTVAARKCSTAGTSRGDRVFGSRTTPTHGPTGPPAPPEGIAPYVPAAVPAADEASLRRRMLDDLFADGGRPDALAPADRSLPLLLCVGRLHPVEQQDLLVRTWLTTELWRTTTLVLVGGGTDRPTPAEQRMRDTLSALPARPAACTGWRPCPRTGAPARRAPPGRR